MTMVTFWVGFALLVAAVATMWHSVGAPFESTAAERHQVSNARSERGSGVAASQARTVEAFTRIHAEGASVIDVEVREGLAHSVEVRTDDNLLGSIRTDVVGGVLEIAPEGTFVSTQDLHVKVTAPRLAGIHLEGANTLTLAIDGQSPLDIRTEGAGRVKATGRLDALTMRSEGAGSIDAASLVARSVDVRLEGAGRASVHATEKLKARIEGAGIVRYAGNPATVDKDIGGIGHIGRID
jgi:hypothetical protein